MRVVAVAAVTAGGKTTVVRELLNRLPKAKSLHFDDYSFAGEVEDFRQWVMDGADYHVWKLDPLEQDIVRIRDSGVCDYLILDYPFAYRHRQIAPYIDVAFFIDTPLDVALARRVLRDMGGASGEEIRADLRMYLDFARPAYLQMVKDILPSSDHVIDGMKMPEEIAAEIKAVIQEGEHGAALSGGRF